MRIRTEHCQDHEAFSLASGLECCDPSLTQQEHKDDCDINVIVKRIGLLPPDPKSARVPTYGDFTRVHDYQSAMEAILAADDAFMELPPALRYEFANDPQRLLEAAEAGRLEAFERHGVLEVKPLQEDAPPAPPAAPPKEEPKAG